MELVAALAKTPEHTLGVHLSSVPSLLFLKAKEATAPCAIQLAILFAMTGDSQRHKFRSLRTCGQRLLEAFRTLSFEFRACALPFLLAPEQKKATVSDAI